jgi:aspartate/methionine/tyrosine aminotransferase
MKLPDFPWDALVPYKQRASEHPEGIVDLSIGTPVDATPEIMQDALIATSNAPDIRRQLEHLNFEMQCVAGLANA